MRTVYGRAMPAHCALYFSADPGDPAPELPEAGAATRRGRDRRGASSGLVRWTPRGPHRLCCTCAPVLDYTGREVARVGLFAHQGDDRALDTEFQQACRELARQISVRLGHLPAAFMSVTA